jgi:predicted DNA-binding antitoxin AbrB/MazE fold protein
MDIIISATYNGIKKTLGDRDNLPTKEHEFINVVGLKSSQGSIRFNDIKLLQKADLKKGTRYDIVLDDDYVNVPIMISANGKTYRRADNNKIVLEEKGSTTDLSYDSFRKRMGQELRAYNLKLKEEGKQPIKPIKRKW